MECYGSLREKHPRGTPVPLEVVVSYVQQAGSALHYAHEQRLIHRDIKPENMLVGKRGEILPGDFGIASIAHSTSSMRAREDDHSTTSSGHGRGGRGTN